LLIAIPASALCRRNNDELRVLRGITRDVEAGNIGSLTAAGIDRTLLREATAQSQGEVASLVVGGAEEDRPARERLALGEDDPRKPAALPLEPDDLIFPHLDADAFQLLPLRARQAIRAVGAENQVVTPHGEGQG
jgi:hypothetical protein